MKSLKDLLMQDSKNTYYLYGQRDIKDTIDRHTLMNMRGSGKDIYRLKYEYDNLYKRYQFVLQIMDDRSHQWKNARRFQIVKDFKLSNKWTKQNI